MVLENFIVDAPIVWDRVGKKIFENPHVKQGRKMRVQITNAGMVEDLSGYTLALGWRHTVSGVVGLDVFEDSSEANVGIFEMAYTENLMTNLGNLKASLVLTSSEDMVIAESNDFYVKVDDSPFGTDAEQGVGSFTRLAEILLNEEGRIQAELTRVQTFNALVDSEMIAQNVETKLTEKEATYAPRMLSAEQQLAHSVDLQSKINSAVSTKLFDIRDTSKGFVTIIDDDCKAEVFTTLKAISETKGVPITICCPTNLIDTAGYMTKAQLLALRDLGWDIQSHGHTHTDLSAKTYDEQLFELSESRRILNSWGINATSVVYPYGSHNLDTIKAVKEVYTAGVQVNSEGYNQPPLYQQTLGRIALGSYMAGGETLVTLKNKINDAVTYNRWIIFMTHIAETDTAGIQLINDTIQHCLDTNVEIVTLTEGLKRRGNLIDLGVHISPNNVNYKNASHFVMGADNEIKTNMQLKSFNNVKVFPRNDYTILGKTPADILALGYAKKYVVPVDANVATEQLFPENRAGVLEIDAYSNAASDYVRRYTVRNYGRIYYSYVLGTGAWSPWQKQPIQTQSKRLAVDCGTVANGSLSVIEISISDFVGVMGTENVSVQPVFTSAFPNEILTDCRFKSTSVVRLLLYNTHTAPFVVGSKDFIITITRNYE